MAATVYLNRDNTVTLSLTQDGVAPNQNVITKAALWVPGSAFSDGIAQVLDTTGSNVTLTDSATKVELSLGSTQIQKGTHYCYLTIYDAVNTNGIAWDTLIIQVSDWPATV